ncbi:hypothetical protein WEH80_27485 [Actinomycetes bacterium KLBMP 9759]
MTEPTEQVPPSEEPKTRPRWQRPRGRGLIIGAAVVALVVVAGVAFALLTPGGGPWRGDRGGHWGPGAIAGERGDVGPWGGPGGPGGHWGGSDGPGRPGERGWWHDRDGGGPDAPIVAGTVASTTADSIVVTQDGGAQRTVRTDDRTRVTGAGNERVGDLQTGERVVIRVNGSGDSAVALLVQAVQSRVTGTVTAVAGDSATVAGFDGLTSTVDTAKLSQKPVVGDLVEITGTVTNGTTVAADGIRILPKAG